MECPVCGYVLEALETECPRCARSREQKSVAAAYRQPLVTVAPSAVKSRCQQCGQPLPSQTALCPTCDFTDAADA